MHLDEWVKAKDTLAKVLSRAMREKSTNAREILNLYQTEEPAKREAAANAKGRRLPGACPGSYLKALAPTGKSGWPCSGLGLGTQTAPQRPCPERRTW